MALIIEERHAGRPAREEALLAAHAESIGLSVERMTWKPFVRHRVKPDPRDIVSGSIAFVRAALQSTGKQLPAQDPYPVALRPWLRREVWRSDALGAVLTAQSLYSETPIFVKPAKRWKLFTGFVVDSPNPAELHGVSRREPVWCSEVVRFVSEWRVYVVAGDVRYVAHCDHGGDRSAEPDRSVIEDAVRAFRSAPSAYAIDFGVLSTGETALIEANDGFSVGAYDDVPAADYFDMIATRWREMAA